MASDTQPEDKPLDFEQSLGELEAIVASLETGDLSLEDSLAAFEAGIKLTRTCQKKLSEAQQKVNVLIENNGSFELASFGQTADASSSD